MPPSSAKTEKVCVLPQHGNQPCFRGVSRWDWVSLKTSAERYFCVLKSEIERDEGMETIYWVLKGREGQGRRKGGTNMTFFAHVYMCVHMHIISACEDYIYIVYVYVCTYIILQHIYEDHSVLVQSLSCVRLFVTPQTAAHQASLSFTISQTLLKFRSIESVMLSSHLILCCLFLFLPSVFRRVKVFSNESALRIRWPKY